MGKNNAVKALVAQLAVPNNEPVKLLALIIEAVIGTVVLAPKAVTWAKVPTLPPPPLPVLTVIGNVEPSPFVKVIVFKLTEAVLRSEPVSVLPPPPLITFIAHEAVPNKEPVIP
jgi:hypothetical protein